MRCDGKHCWIRWFIQQADENPSVISCQRKMQFRSWDDPDLSCSWFLSFNFVAFSFQNSSDSWTGVQERCPEVSSEVYSSYVLLHRVSEQTGVVTISTARTSGYQILRWARPWDTERLPLYLRLSIFLSRDSWRMVVVWRQAWREDCYLEPLIQDSRSHFSSWTQ